MKLLRCVFHVESFRQQLYVGWLSMTSRDRRTLLGLYRRSYSLALLLLALLCKTFQVKKCIEVRIPMCDEHYLLEFSYVPTWNFFVRWVLKLDFHVFSWRLDRRNQPLLCKTHLWLFLSFRRLSHTLQLRHRLSNQEHVKILHLIQLFFTQTLRS